MHCRLAISTLAMIFAITPLGAQWPAVNRDSILERKISVLIDELDGSAGVYVRHLGNGRGVMINADEVFPTASIIKVPILGAIFNLMERGVLAPDTAIVWDDSLRYGDDGGLVNNLRNGTKLPLLQASLMMITTSDNAASLLLQSLAGGGAGVNDWLASAGFDSTRVNSRTPGREEIWRKYGWGQTTPREIAEMVARMREGTLVSAAASDQMYRHLTRIYWNGQALSVLPPYVLAASKQGMVSRSRAEVVLVNAPSGDYVFAVLTKDQSDISYERSNQGYVLIRKVAALLWETFEPGNPWTLPEGAERYFP